MLSYWRSTNEQPSLEDDDVRHFDWQMLEDKAAEGFFLCFEGFILQCVFYEIMAYQWTLQVFVWDMWVYIMGFLPIWPIDLLFLWIVGMPNLWVVLWAHPHTCHLMRKNQIDHSEDYHQTQNAVERICVLWQRPATRTKKRKERRRVTWNGAHEMVHYIFRYRESPNLRQLGAELGQPGVQR